ncbi:hypothetical protein GUITHDRAFT_133757 [Guillardia theta CCMP2712]|uniref:PH domain-containing protein n=1 Tax=Guillardia theta (strain CCMP2712) TaxID=905079 RepID=L1JX07_GUITC|nr:hypothetical protein GUITHDRAFT_133757 [Guillardia theta CCMP2712]EKX52740.1 hypothetical protein GUITHDRAFT_133757 [Guillardia theta CCMP2712]|eukprot:XP_005839720.1 hypothetical protein GUITHDRAFT_133757 [Guillardia theta CCMP2712]
MAAKARLLADHTVQKMKQMMSAVTAAEKGAKEGMRIVIGKDDEEDGILMAGELKKRDGVMRKKWIDVYVELRENSLTCFHSKEDRQILDTVMVDGVEASAVDKNEVFAISIKKASSKGPSILSKDLLIGRLTQKQEAYLIDGCVVDWYKKKLLQKALPSSLQKSGSLEKKSEVEEMGLDSENSWNSMLTEANRQLRELQDELMKEKAKTKALEETLEQVLDNDNATNDSQQGLQQQNIENNNLRLQNDSLTAKISELQKMWESEKNKAKSSEDENIRIDKELQDLKEKLNEKTIETESLKSLQDKLINIEKQKDSGLAAEQGKQMQELSQAIEEEKRRRAEEEGKARELEGKVRELEGKLEAKEKESGLAAEQGKQMQELSQAIEEEKRRRTEEEGKARELEGKVRELEGKLEAKEKESGLAAEQGKQMQELSQAIEEEKRRRAEEEGKARELEGKVRELEGKLEAKEKESGLAAEQGKQMQELSQAIEEEKRRRAEEEGKARELEGKVRELEDKEALSSEKCRALSSTISELSNKLVETQANKSSAVNLEMEQISRCEMIVHDMDSELQNNVAKAEELVIELETSRRFEGELPTSRRHDEDLRAKLDAAEGRARALENELEAVKGIAKSLREQLKRHQAEETSKAEDLLQLKMADTEAMRIAQVAALMAKEGWET